MYNVLNYFGVPNQINPATTVVPRDESLLAQLQPSLTRFSLTGTASAFTYPLFADWHSSSLHLPTFRWLAQLQPSLTHFSLTGTAPAFIYPHFADWHSSSLHLPTFRWLAQLQPSFTHVSLSTHKGFRKEQTLIVKEPGVGAVVTYWGRLFHSGMVLGQKVFCLCMLSGEMKGQRWSHGYVGWFS